MKNLLRQANCFQMLMMLMKM